jgi:hypothetical protein
MVIAAGGDEQGARISADHHLEAEHAAVEGLGLGQLGDLEVGVTDAGAVRRDGLTLGLFAELAQEVAQVQRQGGHLQLAVLYPPVVVGAVAVDLDSVAVRVRQIQRLADQVVGGSVQRPAGVGQPSEGVGEIQP